MLTHSQVAKALSKAAGFDNRTVTQSAVAAWQEALQRWPNMTEDELLAAITDHYATSGDFMQVAHVYPAVKRIRERREVQRSRQRALEPPRPSGPGFDTALGSHLLDPEFQRRRMNSRIKFCDEFELPHDGDGWTSVDRPNTASAGRVTALEDFGRF